MIPALVASAITIASAWSRPAVDQGVVYATISNASARREVVVGASSPVARTVELHESESMKTTMAMAMAMHPVSRLPIPAHGSVTLKPGGYHLMLLGLHRPLVAGQHFPIVVRFADGTSARTTVTVENRAL